MTKKEMVEVLKDFYNVKQEKKTMLKKSKQELRDWLTECELYFGR